MMCAYVLKPESKEHGWLYRLSERGFDGLLHTYEEGLKIVLRHRFITLMVMLGTVVFTGYLYVIIPKGFFPQQDTGLIIGQSEAAQDISFQAMLERQQVMQDAIMRDPAVATVGSAVGAGGGVYTLNDGRVYIQLKPNNQRDPIGQVIARLRTNLAKIQGITLYMQAAQDVTIGARLNKTQFQYTMNDADPGELNHWAALFLDKIKAVPGITDVTTDQLNAGPMLDITIKREVASSYGILPYTIDNTLDDAFGQRIVSTIYTTLQQYHVILEVNPKFQYGPEALNGIYVKSSSGQQVPISTLVDTVVKVAPLVVNHQGQFPSVTISFNLAPGTAIGQAVSGIQTVEKELHPPLSLQTSFQGNAQAFGASLSSTPILIGASLFVIYLILGILYESLIHPITIISTLPSAGVGALLLLMAVHTDLTVIAIVGIILLIGIVKKNGIMLVDFAQQVEHEKGLSAEEAIYQACRAALSADPDDHDGGPARRRADDGGYGGRLGDSPAARLRHRRRPRSVADSDALYDAGRLYLPRPAAVPYVPAKEEASGFGPLQAIARGIMTGKLRSIMGTPMTLHFPNASRNYNPTQRCVCFWGHDSAFEVSFHLDEEALCKISPMWIATKRRCCMCSTSIASESRKPPALLIRGGGRIIIDCRRRIYWNRSIVGGNMARGDRHGNREAKKLKPKEIAPLRPFLICTSPSSNGGSLIRNFSPAGSKTTGSPVNQAPEGSPLHKPARRANCASSRRPARALSLRRR